MTAKMKSVDGVVFPLDPEQIDAALSRAMNMRGHECVHVLIRALEEARTAGRNLLSLIEAYESIEGNERLTDDEDDETTRWFAERTLRPTKSELAAAGLPIPEASDGGR